MHARDHEDSDWEDLVQRLGGTPDQAHTPPAPEPPVSAAQIIASGPRDYALADEQVDDFRPPEPRPLGAGNPRTVLSWVGVVGAAVVGLLAVLLDWSLSWWLSAVVIGAFLCGAISLFFLLPKTWAHRPPRDDDDYGHGAKL